MESVYCMKKKYYNSDDYKTRYAKVNRLKIKYNRYDFRIEEFYKIADIRKMQEIIGKILDRVDNYRSPRTISSFVKQWILYNKIYKLLIRLNIKKSYKYRFHYKLNIFQKICLELLSIFSFQRYKYFFTHTKYEIYYHIYKGDLIKWIKKKKKKKLNLARYMM